MKNKKTIVSWNVNGVRAAVRKGFLDWLDDVGPEIVCIQETKAHVDQLTDEVLQPKGYVGVWNQAERKGYSGVATFTKEAPLSVVTKFGESLLDEEGRIVLTEHKDFYLFNVYFPNGGRGEERLQYKMDFYKRFLELMNEYRAKGKSVIVCGDVNTAHNEIDLARPKPNMKNTGFLPIERAWLDQLVEEGYVDTFRNQYPEKAEMYSWWDMKTRARDRNVGWRIDYFWISDDAKDRVKDAFIWSEVLGSDHCPVGIVLESKN